MAELPPLERAKRLAEALLSERGEASGAAVARELLAASRELDAAGRAELYRFFAENFGPDASRLRAAAEAWLAEPTPENAARLAEAAEPPRQELLRRMNMTPGGTAALVAARQEVLGRLRDEPALKPLDSDLKHLLGSWFNRGFLELRRIDWQTPAAVLEKLIEYEAVHEIQGWDDLRRRLAADRRCFGFFHPALPGEPLIFVEVALVEGLAAAVQPLLARDGACEDAAGRCAARADTAIFYSISNCQEGLRGISFGNFLIKQVVEELKDELPRFERFATLSPVPGFRRWLDGRLASPEAAEPPARPERRPCSRRPGTAGRRRGGAGRAAARRPLVGGPGPGGSAARAADAPLRRVPHRRERRAGPPRPGGALPPRQRRPAGAGELARQHRPARDPGVLRRDGELPLRPRTRSRRTTRPSCATAPSRARRRWRRCWRRRAPPTEAVRSAGAEGASCPRGCCCRGSPCPTSRSRPG